MCADSFHWQHTIKSDVLFRARRGRSRLLLQLAEEFNYAANYLSTDARIPKALHLIVQFHERLDLKIMKYNL